MNFNLTLFSQKIKFLNREQFSTIVRKYSTDKYSKGVKGWTHFVSMLFCHLAKANSLREIIGGMLSMEVNLFHIGVKDKVPRKSTLSYISEHRNWELFRDYYISLHKIFVNETGIKSKKFRIKRKNILVGFNTDKFVLENL